MFYLNYCFIVWLHHVLVLIYFGCLDFLYFGYIASLNVRNTGSYLPMLEILYLLLLDEFYVRLSMIWP